MSIHWVDEVPSTNDAVRALVREQGAPHGTAVAARHQTAGRGRLGRRWDTPPGTAVLMSVLVRRPLSAEQAPLLCLAAAVAVAEVAGARYRIKWPNDVLAPDGRKVAGILAEAEWASGALAYAIVGMGINVRAHPALPNAAHLDEDGTDRNVEAVAEGVRAALLRWVGLLEADVERVLDTWRRRSATLGHPVRIGAIEGVATGLDQDGALRVRAADGVESRVLAGDVEMVGTLRP